MLGILLEGTAPALVKMPREQGAGTGGDKWQGGRQGGGPAQPGLKAIPQALGAEVPHPTDHPQRDLGTSTALSSPVPGPSGSRTPLSVHTRNISWLLFHLDLSEVVKSHPICIYFSAQMLN